VRAAVPGLLAEYLHEGSRYEELLAATVTPVRRSLDQIIDTAMAAGEATAGVSREALLDVLLGAVLLEAMTRNGDAARPAAARIADVVRRATT
jgi:hypothetical protein